MQNLIESLDFVNIVNILLTLKRLSHSHCIVKCGCLLFFYYKRFLRDLYFLHPLFLGAQSEGWGEEAFEEGG